MNYQQMQQYLVIDEEVQNVQNKSTCGM